MKKIDLIINSILYVLLSISFIGLIYGIHRLITFYPNLFDYYTYYNLFFFLLIIFLLFTIFAKKNIKINLVIFLFSTLFAIYLFQIIYYFKYKPVDISRAYIHETVFAENGIVKEDDLFPTHVNYFPTAIITSLSESEKKRKNVFLPLSGISKVPTKMNTENGKFISFISDRYGFNNLDDVYENNNIDILLLGDSFTEGYSVMQKDTIAGVLREKKYNAISLGKRNSSSLQQFAIFKEYGVQLSPKNIVIIFYEGNDFDELVGEIKLPILREYVKNDNFLQNLSHRQDEVDEYLLELEKKETSMMKTYAQEDKEYKHFNVFHIITLRDVRQLLKKFYKNINSKSVSSDMAIEYFKLSLTKIKKYADTWNGKVYFVYIPHNVELFRFKEFKMNKIGIKNKKKIISAIKELNIDLIDLKFEMFDKTNDPLSYYPLNTADFNHLNERGYEKIAELIKQKIN